ncbi:hypothetical protein BKA69DRAFT_665672 [Paraphysoderma sedebokerense]|nr:hypothetical protein BKA69DRAFT_665672 [Paraphysoderma sedebokerense]
MEWESCHAFLLPEDSTTVSSFLTIHPSASSSSTSSSSARNPTIKLSFPSSSKPSSTLETKSIQQTAFTLPAGMMDSVYIDFHRDRDRDREVHSGEKFPGIWNSGFESGAKTRVGVDAEVDEEVQIGDGWIGRVSGLGKDVAGFVRSCWTRSNYVVTTSLPKVVIQLTPSIYSTIQQLSNSFTKFSPKMLYPTPSPSSTLHPDAKNTDTFHLCRDSDEEESDPESGNTTDAFSGTGGDSVVFESQPYNERLLLPRHEQQKRRNQREKKGVNCFMTVVCNVEEASVVLVQPDSKVQGHDRKYTLSMDDMGISMIYGYDSSPTMYTHLSTRDLTLIDTTHEHPITIVSSLFSHFHSQSPLHRPSSVSPSSSFYPLQPRQNLNLQLTYLSSYDKEVKVTENNVTMVFDKNVVRYAVQDQVWSDLIAFFAGPTATVRRFLFVFSVFGFSEFTDFVWIVDCGLLMNVRIRV